MLLPHDWRDGRGAVRASVAITDAAGRRRELWSGTLRTSDWGRPRGLQVDCRLPDSSTSLQSQHPGGAERYGPGRWHARSGWRPAIIDPPPRRSRERRPTARPGFGIAVGLSTRR